MGLRSVRSNGQPQSRAPKHKRVKTLTTGQRAELRTIDALHRRFAKNSKETTGKVVLRKAGA